MKVKMLSRNPHDHIRERKQDLHHVPRNPDPALHPFEEAREYTRALNATKLERVFAKPFVGDLSGHTDGVSCFAKHPKRLSCLVSGACDGEIRVWDLSSRQCTSAFVGHSGFVRGMCVAPSGESLLSVGDDKIVKRWSLTAAVQSHGDSTSMEPTHTILGKAPFTSISHHYSEPLFATSGNQIDIWDEERSEPVRSFSWGCDTVGNVCFNPVEVNICGSCGSDRSIVLYDARGSTPLRKVVLEMKSNCIAWNPREAFNFTAANEDGNLYTFDMRKLTFPLNVHTDHVSAVMDVDYSRTGREFVSASYDKTIRIFPMQGGHSREVYHTKRMQRVFTICWSSDGKFIASGSDEMNIRLWKAKAWEKLGPVSARERAAHVQSEKLKTKYSSHPQIRRIQRHRHIPHLIHSESKKKKDILSKIKRKEENVRRHTKPSKLKPRRPERKKHIVGTVE
ncbi:DDB1- and CUL4-associated factor 13-like [Sycon ciliatum]|uniref:DDB1- and CUL4-associated factor 13-like n=1 Tax=Sycon ciliatum TaxID=27933 RepID=UPI0031F72025